ncbi:MAG: hypothetical protein JXR68_08730 [Bacteroidales bacterium]|nr:hypothetical protein [Bacteroidales bacterium]
MKILIEPTKKTANSKKQIVDLKNYLQKNGVKTDVVEIKPKKGELGRGIASGLATILTGGETIFSRLGEALVKYVEGRRVDLTMKNGRGEELILSAAIPKAEIRSLINEFFERKIASNPKTIAELKQNEKRAVTKKTSTKKAATTKPKAVDKTKSTTKKTVSAKRSSVRKKTAVTKKVVADKK